MVFQSSRRGKVRHNTRKTDEQAGRDERGNPRYYPYWHNRAGGARLVALW